MEGKVYVIKINNNTIKKNKEKFELQSLRKFVIDILNNITQEGFNIDKLSIFAERKAWELLNNLKNEYPEYASIIDNIFRKIKEEKLKTNLVRIEASSKIEEIEKELERKLKMYKNYEKKLEEELKKYKQQLNEELKKKEYEIEKEYKSLFEGIERIKKSYLDK